MHYSEALDRISEIHAHLAKGEVYRGFRSWTVALSGASGLAAAALQPMVLSTDDPLSTLFYWLVVAAVGGVIGGSETVYNYVFRDDPYARRHTRKVIGQFLPCLAAGAGVTLALARSDSNLIGLLPGLWAILFGLGVFAARPYLPRSIGWVALYYLAAGVALLITNPSITELAPWTIGGTFGAGQLAAALVLYWNLERTDHAEED